ncbi:MAG: flagellar protein FlaG [Burkholderiales bacterium]
MDIRPLGSAVQPASIATPAPASESDSTAAAATGSPVTATTTGSAPTSPAPSVAAVSPEPSVSQVRQAVQKINTVMKAQSQGIEFSIDPASHRIVVNIVDQSTNQVLRQIPSKEALAIADSLDQKQGLLIQQQA